MNMKALYFAFGGFVAGSIAGSISTIFFLKKKYEDLANSEIAEIREMYKNKVEKEAETYSQKDEKPEESEKTDISKEEVEKADKIASDAGYTFYSKKTTQDSKNEANAPYVITPEEFGEEEDYEKVTLMFYSDQIIADMNDDIVENVNAVIGFESLNHFGEYEDDSVYVRNDRFKCDYEILKDLRTYSDVIKDRSSK